MNVLILGDFYPNNRLEMLATARPDEIFDSFAGVIREADLAILNLETPLCKPHAPIAKTGPNLWANPESATFLSAAGLGLVTLANNHIFDFGLNGLEETFQNLTQSGIAYVGAGKSRTDAAQPFLLERGGKTLAVLNFAENEWSTTGGDGPGANPIDPVMNFRAISAARRQYDWVLVICHGGHENYPLPSPRMKELFRFYVDAGATAVVNHHTHCVSGYEVYRSAPIFYSIGNFLFDNPVQRTGPWTEGIGVTLSFTDKVTQYDIHHFDQCTTKHIFQACSPGDSLGRTDRLQAINSTIDDSKLLEQSFSEYVNMQRSRYMRYLEPSTFRLMEALQSRGFAPSLLRPRQRRLLLNLIRCEAHRDVLLGVLERDVGHSR
jgi:hypothetical protein